MPKKRPQGELLESSVQSSIPVPKRVKSASVGKKNKKAKSAPTPAFTTSRLPVRPSIGLHTKDADLTGSQQFYQSGSGSNSIPPTQQNLNRLFDQYRDQPKEAPDHIHIAGAQRYLEDLGVQLDEVAHLALCDLLQCPSLGEFEREAFVSGWKSLAPGHPSSPNQSFDTITRQSAHISTMRKRLTSETSYFKQVYRNAFKLAKPEGQKSVPLDAALEFWSMFFGRGKGGIEWNSSTTKWLDLWLGFYQEQGKRPVNKDLWNMVGELVTKTKDPGGESLDWWTEDGAWPMAIDDFVAHVKEKRKLSGENMDVS